MSFLSKKNDIFYLLGFWIDFYYISGERISRIVFISDDKLFFFYDHFNDLVVYCGIIKISSKQKEDQYCPDDIAIEDGEQKDACENHGKHQVPYLASLELFSVVDENAHHI